MTITVKRLEWHDTPTGSTMAVCLLGIYWFDGLVVRRNGPKIFEDGEHHFGVWELFHGSDMNAAKAAAQRDFESIILASLETET